MKEWTYINGQPISKEDMSNLPTGFEELFFGVNFPDRKTFCDASFLACHANAEFNNGILLKDKRCMATSNYLKNELDKILDNFRDIDQLYVDDHHDEIEDMYVHW